MMVAAQSCRLRSKRANPREGCTFRRQPVNDPITRVVYHICRHLNRVQGGVAGWAHCEHYVQKTFIRKGLRHKMARVGERKTNRTAVNFASRAGRVGERTPHGAAIGTLRSKGKRGYGTALGCASGCSVTWGACIWRFRVTVPLTLASADVRYVKQAPAGRVALNALDAKRAGSRR